MLEVGMLWWRFCLIEVLLETVIHIIAAIIHTRTSYDIFHDFEVFLR